MSLNINQLNNLATQFENSDRSSTLSLNQNGQFAVNSTLGSRISAYFSNKETKQAVVQNLINTLKTAEGFNDAQRAAADKLLSNHLNSGKTLNVREAAVAIREFVAIKTNEEAYIAETRTTNAKGAASQIFEGINGNPPEFDKILDASLAWHGLTKADISADEMANIKTQLTDKLVALANDSRGRTELAKSLTGSSETDTNRSLTFEEAKKSFSINLNKMFVTRTKASQKEMINPKISHNSNTDALPTRIKELAEARGITTPIKPQHMEFLAVKIDETFYRTCFPFDQSQISQPTTEKANASLDKIINRFLDSMAAVDNSSLSDEQKSIAKIAISGSGILFTPKMVDSLCKSIQPMSDYLLDLTDRSISREKATEVFDRFTKDLVKYSNDSDFVGEILGADETIALCDVIGQAAFASCKMINLENPDKSLALKTFNQLMSPGSPMSGAIYDKLESLKGNSDIQYKFKNQILNGSITPFLQVLGHTSNKPIAENRTLGSMSTLQAEQRLEKHPQDLDLDAYKETVSASFMAAVDKPSTHKPYNLKIKPELQKLADDGDKEALDTIAGINIINQFGEHFMKDFCRVSITVNGELIGGADSNDVAGMVREIKKLMTHFPSIEVAKQVLNPFHQGIAGDLFSAIVISPKMEEKFDQMATLQDLTQVQNHSINVNEDGSYTLIYDFAQESKEMGKKFSDFYYGVNTIAQFKVVPQADQNSGTWTLEHANTFYTQVSAV